MYSSTPRQRCAFQFLLRSRQSSSSGGYRIQHSSRITTALTCCGCEQRTGAFSKTWDEFNGRVHAIPTVELRPAWVVTSIVLPIKRIARSNLATFSSSLILDRTAMHSIVRRRSSNVPGRPRILRKSRLSTRRALFETRAMSREDFHGRQTELNQTAAEIRAAEAAVPPPAQPRFHRGSSANRRRVGRDTPTVGNGSGWPILTTLVWDPMHVYFDCDEHSFLRAKELRCRNDRGNNAYLGPHPSG